MKIEAYLELAKTYQKRREEAKALQIYQKAIKLSEKDHRPYYEAGLILARTQELCRGRGYAPQRI